MIYQPLEVNSLNDAADWLSQKNELVISPSRLINFEYERLLASRQGSRSVFKAALPDTTFSYLVDVDLSCRESKFPGFRIKGSFYGSLMGELMIIHLFEIITYGSTTVGFAEQETEDGYGRNVLVTDEANQYVKVSAEMLRVSKDSLLFLDNVILSKLKNNKKIIEDHEAKKLTPVQQDRQDYQLLAKKAWENDPSLNRTKIRSLDGLRNYKGKYVDSTLNRWRGCPEFCVNGG